MNYWYPLSTSTIGDAEIKAATAVLNSRQTTMGDKVAEFEEAFAAYLGVDHAVMVNSGSSADLLMAHATKTRAGEVLIPAVTWPTHVWSFVNAGYRVRFVDVDGLNTSEALINKAISPQTVAVSGVHLMGVPADLGFHPGLTVTEDCCEALGSGVGKDHPASWSFFFSHHMTTLEGGAVTTNDPDLADRLRSMRSHGWARGLDYATDTDPRYTFIMPGFNVRPTEIAAAIGLVQLKRLNVFNKHRQQNRKVFVDMLTGIPGIEIPDIPEDAAPFGLPFFCDCRDDLALFLELNGVETRPILGGNLLRQPAFKDWPKQDLPGADRVHDEGLYVGLHPTYNSGIGKMADLIRSYLR